APYCSSIVSLISHPSRLERDARKLNRHCERSEAIQKASNQAGLLRRFAPRNDDRSELELIESLAVGSQAAHLAAMIPLSILDLAPIVEGGTAASSFRQSLNLAQHAERWGYRRFWMAEHHSMPGIASAATSVALAYIGAGTSTIRIGAGGIMLPNHAPLAIAEQFGTLESLYPGRIDLGLGRAPGTDQAAAYALRRNLAADEGQFPRDVVELMHYFRPT